MKKSCLLLVIICILPMVVQAQADIEDVIYLKDGGILRGEIIEQSTESLKIKTAGRNVFAVNIEEIKEIKKEELPDQKFYKESGYINYSSIDVLPGSTHAIARLQMINGYQFTPRFSAGLGVGFVWYNDPLNLIPLFIDLKYRFAKANTAPFVFFKSGYSFSVNTDENIPIDSHSGGIMVSPGVGLQFETGRDFGLYFTAGYNLDKATFEEEGWNGRIITNDISYRRLLFGFGLSF